jgi:protoheme ferro-lyase
MLAKKTPPLGVVLVNLGTPDAPTAPAVRRYLKLGTKCHRF